MHSHEHHQVLDLRTQTYSGQQVPLILPYTERGVSSTSLICPIVVFSTVLTRCKCHVITYMEKHKLATYHRPKLT